MGQLIDRLRDHFDDDERVDGRELVELVEPGSDDRLLHGLLERLAEHVLGDDVEPDALDAPDVELDERSERAP
jgi:hypothetical protein